MFLWLGLYLLTRAPQRSTITLASVGGLLGQAVFFASSVLTYTALTAEALVTLERLFWWSAVMPVAAWFHFSSLIVRRITGQRYHQRDKLLVELVYTAAIALSVIGSATDLINDYGAPVQRVGRYLDLQAGPVYGLYIVYVVGTAAGALAYLAHALRHMSRSQRVDDRPLLAQFRLLIGGALLFLVGALGTALAAYVGIKNWLVLLPAYLCLLGGLAVIGYSIAQFNMLLEGQAIRRDFFYSLTGISALNLLYLGMLLVLGVSSIYAVLALVGLVTLTHSMLDVGRRLWDKLFFDSDEQAARAEARDYASVLGTDPVTPPFEQSLDAPAEASPAAQPAADLALAPLNDLDEKTFKALVRKAITGIKSPPQLAKSSLLALEIVQQRVVHSGQPDHRLNRMAALRELLIEQIEALQPSDNVSSAVSDAWRFYNVLYYPYVRGIGRKSAFAEARRMAAERQRNGQREPSELENVLAWLADVEEDTFYKWQRRASDTIAAFLWEENQRAKQGQETKDQGHSDQVSQSGTRHLGV
jgi:hypothetical protein